MLRSIAKIHCENLKPFPVVSPEVDQCTECGFCESICPSRSLTLTPRQRIQLAREWQDLSHIDRRRLRKALRYAVDQTCATDHLCAILCPLDLDVGAFVLQQRQQRQPGWKQRFAIRIARHFSVVEMAVRWGIRIAKGIAETPVAAVLPAGARSRLVSGTPVPLPLQVARIVAAQERNVAVWAQAPFCCGLVFDSRGFPDAGRWIRERSLQQLMRHFPYRGGRFYHRNGHPIEILLDHSSCATHWQERLPQYPIQDAQWYGLQRCLPVDTLENAAVHIACWYEAPIMLKSTSESSDMLLLPF